MILTDEQIREALEAGSISIEPFDEAQLEPATYDIRVGGQGVTTTSKKVIDIEATGYLSVAPGDFAVVLSLESIRLDAQHTGRFGLRSKYARKGLIATTGPQIDPGFYGCLIVGVTNLTPRPITLPFEDDFLSVEFHRLSRPVADPYDGPYQGRLKLGPEEIEFITESEGMALSEVLTTLRSLSANVANLTENLTSLTGEVKSLKWIIPLIVAVAIAIITLIVSN